MQLQQRINAFSALGDFLKQFSEEVPEFNSKLPHNDKFYEPMLETIELAKIKNKWFTKENLRKSFQAWASQLTEERLTQWLTKYNLPENPQKKIAIVMAGNIPLVGFHDFLSVLICGFKVDCKLSSNDDVLLPFLSKYLIAIESGFSSKIEFSKENLSEFDAVIATGSNNTARYFEYYFGKYPSIIRKNRNSVAVLSGKESPTELEALADDIFQYFGLGCRNVSKIFVPENYDFDRFFKGMFKWKEIINNHKYINNYDYNKAVYLMSNINLLDNEFMLLKEDVHYASPISVVFYEYYSNLDELENRLIKDNNQIQVLVGNLGIKGEVAFGQAQKPSLADYSDGVDVIKFLTSLE